jgi:protein-disulfide isomerase
LSSRKEQREQARAEREAREAAERAKAQRNKRLIQVGAALAAVAAVVVIVVLVAGGGGDDSKGGSAGGGGGSTHAAELLDGIPQKGDTLGNPNAPITLIEFADFQCPFCRDFTVKTFPTIVAKYVRTGKVKMVFRNYAFIGPDSVTAARAAEAAGQQNRLWYFVDVFYNNQGEENSGYVTEAFLEKIGADAGVDVEKMLAAREDPRVDQAIAQAQQEAQENGVNSTPSFLVQKGDGAPEKLEVDAFDPAKFSATLDQLLAGK